MATLFEYAVIVDDKRDAAGTLVEPASVVVEPGKLLAKDQQQAIIQAGAKVPDDVANDPEKMDRLVVICRPF